MLLDIAWISVSGENFGALGRVLFDTVLLDIVLTGALFAFGTLLLLGALLLLHGTLRGALLRVPLPGPSTTGGQSALGPLFGALLLALASVAGRLELAVLAAALLGAALRAATGGQAALGLLLGNAAS